MEERKETTSSGRIIPRSGINDRLPYEHQKKAMECMDRINSGSDFSTLVVLPTGGGKTYAGRWERKSEEISIFACRLVCRNLSDHLI